MNNKPCRARFIHHGALSARARLLTTVVCFSLAGSVTVACSHSANSDSGSGGAGTGAVGAGAVSAGGTSADGGSSGNGGTFGSSGATSDGGASSSGAASGTGGGSTMMTGGGGVGAIGGGPSGGGAPGTGGALNLAPLGISDLEIAPNPNMTTSCYVRWKTSEPANSEVRFGEGSLQLRIVQEDLVTDHEVLVIGMHAETSYMIAATSTNAQATGIQEGTFTTGALPAGVPTSVVSVNDKEKSQVGWTLTNIQVGSATSTGFTVQSNYPAIIVIVDEDGFVVWYHFHGTTKDSRGDVSTNFLPNGNVLVGPGTGESPREVDLAGNVVWTGPPQSGGGFPGGGGGGEPMSHHVGKLNSGNYILIRDINGGAVIEEITPALDVVWSWDLSEHVTIGSGDWCHPNSVWVDETADWFSLSCRFQGIFKAQRSGELLWYLGVAIDDANSGEFSFDPPASKPNDIHDPEFHDDGTLLVYDNQGWESRQGNGNYHSRVLEFQIDEVTKTATRVWEFPGSFAVDSWFTDEWSTPFWGDADRLENGNILITAGTRGAGTVSKIFEVTRAGEVVWELTWPEDHGSYRATRISPPPLVQPLP